MNTLIKAINNLINRMFDFLFSHADESTPEALMQALYCPNCGRKLTQ